MLVLGINEGDYLQIETPTETFQIKIIQLKRHQVRVGCVASHQIKFIRGSIVEKNKEKQNDA